MEFWGFVDYKAHLGGGGVIEDFVGIL